MAPVPGNSPSRIKVALTKLVGEDPHQRFGTQLIRIASDMIAVCNEDLEIIFHNQAFVKGMGYRDGSFTGQSLLFFFPSADRFDAESAFSGLVNGHAAGLRINASVLTKRAVSQFDIRVVKSRMINGEFLYYLIAREEKPQSTTPKKIESVPLKHTSFFDALPVAVWRTDKRLKITDAEGSLWSEINLNAASQIGESVEGDTSTLLPNWFKRLDFCDTMAGQSFHLEVCDESGNFDVTIEPV